MLIKGMIIMECFECDYWKQLANDGEDICLLTKVGDDACAIPISNERPSWCPLENTKTVT